MINSGIASNFCHGIDPVYLGSYTRESIVAGESIAAGGHYTYNSQNTCKYMEILVHLEKYI